MIVNRFYNLLFCRSNDRVLSLLERGFCSSVNDGAKAPSDTPKLPSELQNGTVVAGPSLIVKEKVIDPATSIAETAKLAKVADVAPGAKSEQQIVIETATFPEPRIRKSRLSVTVKNLLIFRTEIVDRNVSAFMREIRQRLNELTVRSWVWDDVKSYRTSFIRLLQSGVENISLAMNWSRMNHYNYAVMNKFADFFAACKSQYREFEGSERARNCLIILISKATAMGVNLSNVVNTKVITFWHYGLQNVVFRRVFSVDRTINITVSRINVSKLNTKSVTTVKINDKSYTLDNVEVLKTNFILERLIVLADTAWSVLIKRVSIMLHNFELTPRYKYTTQERVAVVNTRGEGSILGYTITEPAYGNISLVITNKQRFLMAFMAAFSSTIVTNDYLTSQWVYLMVQDTMAANSLNYNLCDFTFQISTIVKPAEDEELRSMPWSIAVFNDDQASFFNDHTLVAGTLLAGLIHDTTAFAGFDVFDWMPSPAEVEFWRRGTVPGYWDHSTEVGHIPGLVVDSTLSTPVEFNDLLYLMYIYCGRYTPIVFTPLVIEEANPYSQRLRYDLYEVERISWWSLFVNEEVYKVLHEDVAPFTGAKWMADDDYPRLLYCVQMVDPKRQTG